MAESQHDHRMRLESHVLTSNVKAQRLGTILGFVIAMTAIVGGFWLIHEGRSTAGLVPIITALVGLAGVFVYAKREQKKDLAKKADGVA